MLIEGHDIAEVAVECGFADQSHFTRHFKRTFGVTPALARAKVDASAARRALASDPSKKGEHGYWSSRF
jgi:AraC-like DNA-binding protein